MLRNLDAIFGDILTTKSRLLSDNTVPNDLVLGIGEKYEWLWLPYSDPDRVLEMRNSPRVRNNMSDTSFITRKEHASFLKKYESLHRLDFIVQHKTSKEYVGAMYISLTQHGFEIGKYIGNETFLGKGLSFPMSMCFIEYLKKNVSEIGDIYAVTKLVNYKNINLNFKIGFKIIKLVDGDAWLMELQ